ncbi:SH3 domain-containing protein [Phaeovulum sp.]|uniref:SH3 domain-containing protein n=1 Tax=Phaeovulum sp. TaxID=2934796 RepID=UPI0039E71AC6
MIRLTFYLMLTLFLTMLIAGRDGPDTVKTAATLTTEAALETAVPASIVTRTDSTPLALAIPVSASPPEAVTPTTASLRMPGPPLRPSPELVLASQTQPAPQVWRVNTNRLNVRAGPSTGHSVVDRLTRGDEALVISDPTAEWVQIRIEGDGVDGWVARRLLTPADN